MHAVAVANDFWITINAAKWLQQKRVRREGNGTSGILCPACNTWQVYLSPKAGSWQLTGVVEVLWRQAPRPAFGLQPSPCCLHKKKVNQKST